MVAPSLTVYETAKKTRDLILEMRDDFSFIENTVFSLGDYLRLSPESYTATPEVVVWFGNPVIPNFKLLIEELILVLQLEVQESHTFFDTVKLIRCLNHLNQEPLIRAGCKNKDNILTAEKLIPTISSDSFEKALSALSELDR